MKTQERFGKLAGISIMGAIMGILLLSLSTLALAESDTARAIRASAATVPTNIPGIHTYAEPPKGFDKVTATDIELATYGFPPRPDKQADRDRYAQWERAMKAANTRWTGQLKPLPGGGQGLVPADAPLPEAVHPETGPYLGTATNASGVVLFNYQTAWSSKKSFEIIGAEFSVPVTQFPFSSNCSQDYASELSFVGIDGTFYVGTNYAEVFQPGLVGGEVTAVFCDPTQTEYFAGFGWAPQALLGTFDASPGDVFLAQVQLLDTNDGSVFLEDLTTQTYATYAVSTCEAGVCTNLPGRSAEWTVSRGCCEGPGPNGEWPLANTTHIFFSNGFAELGNAKPYWPGSQTPSLTEVLTMLDDNLDQDIETVNQGSSGPEGLTALLFSTTGCAQSGGCAP